MLMRPLQHCKILLVEDEVDTRILFTIMLQKAGAMVEAVGCAEEALHVLQQVQPDVLLCDILMPEMDGFSLINRVRNIEILQTIPAVAITGLGAKGEEEWARKAGFQYCLTKPVDSKTLVEAVKQLVPCKDERTQG